MRIVFVCEGNTCRSPMAEALLKKELKSRKVNGIDVSSAGIWADDGAPPSPEMVSIGKDFFGVDISSHRTTRISSDIFRESDLILTMTAEEAEFLKRLFPVEKEKIFNIGEYIDGNPENVEDPFGRDRRTYKRVADSLDGLVKKLVVKLERGG